MNQNVEKFEKYMEKYHKLIFWNVGKYSRSGLEEDIVQETLMRMYERLEYLNEENIIPWLLTVSRNIAKDYEKKGGRFSEENIPIESVGKELEKKSFDKSPEELCEQAWETEALRRFLKRAGDLLYEKNPKWYFIMIDAVILEMNGKAIAETLGTSMANVDVMRYRAKTYIKKHLGKEAAEYL